MKQIHLVHERKNWLVNRLRVKTKFRMAKLGPTYKKRTANWARKVLTIMGASTLRTQQAASKEMVVWFMQQAYEKQVQIDHILRCHAKCLKVQRFIKVGLSTRRQRMKQLQSLFERERKIMISYYF